MFAVCVCNASIVQYVSKFHHMILVSMVPWIPQKPQEKYEVMSWYRGMVNDVIEALNGCSWKTV
jgi:hypothetical protein